MYLLPFIALMITIVLLTVMYFMYMRKNTNTNRENTGYRENAGGESYTEILPVIDPELATSNSGITPSYQGLVLFDVDQTLTTGKQNEAVVQECLNNRWAVGICTANASYNMSNLSSFRWMPKNLYEFMVSTNGVTFNNVASGILSGKYDMDTYQRLTGNIPRYIDIHGYRKGFALVHTGKVLNINNVKRMILCDDLSAFIQGARTYNPDIGIVCSGFDCGGQLTVHAIKKEIEKCMINTLY